MANTSKSKKLKSKLVIYQAKDGAIEFRGDFDKETIWVTQNDLVNLYGKDQSVISRHIKNIFKDREVDQKSNMQKMHIANSDKPVRLYSLDIILAVGYRTNSAAAIEFRKWSSGILKQYIYKGYNINPKIISKNYNEFLGAIDKVKELLPGNQLISSADILELIKSFAGTWFSLESYDEQDFPGKGFSKKKIKIQAEELYEAIGKFKKQLIKKKQATDLFAQEKRNKNLEGIFGNVMQGAFGKEMYPTVEEKAAHLLYFIVKNHPFNDGNKRTGAFSFIWFLQKAGVSFRTKISPETLTALTLLIAESKPKDKDKMIGVVLLLLKRGR